jgi:thioredoxin-like negative regulator of GroEL
MGPHFAEAAEQMDGKVKFAKVDVESNPEISQRFEIMSIPTIIIFKDGEQINRVSGAMPSEELVSLAEEAL